MLLIIPLQLFLLNNYYMNIYICIFSGRRIVGEFTYVYISTVKQVFYVHFTSFLYFFFVEYYYTCATKFLFHLFNDNFTLDFIFILMA